MYACGTASQGVIVTIDARGIHTLLVVTAHRLQLDYLVQVRGTISRVTSKINRFFFFFYFNSIPIATNSVCKHAQVLIDHYASNMYRHV